MNLFANYKMTYCFFSSSWQRKKVQVLFLPLKCLLLLLFTNQNNNKKTFVCLDQISSHRNLIKNSIVLENILDLINYFMINLIKLIFMILYCISPSEFKIINILIQSNLIWSHQIINASNWQFIKFNKSIFMCL